MGVADPNMSRLKLLIFLAVFLSFMYIAEAVMLTSNQTPTQVEYMEQYETDFEGTETEEATSLGEAVISGAQFITFTIPQIPLWMRMILAPISLVMLIILAYIIIDYAYDVIKAFPFT